jgi:isoleucyl-tRNA synthetase
MNEDKISAFQTLYTCLETISLLIAPISPFIADKLYQDLTSVGNKNASESVHLANFPTVNEAIIDKDLESRMAVAQTITSMVLSLRRKVNIKVRQPLSTVMVPVLDDSQRDMINTMSDLILTEVNVKNLKIVSNEEGVLVKRIKPDFKKLGPKFGKNMKAVANQLQNIDQHSIAQLEQHGELVIDLAGQQATILLEDVEVISEDIPGWLVANEGNLTVALDVTITDELRQEGIAREIINRIQNIRKGRNYDITDKIILTFEPNEATNTAIESYKEYIGRQVLASNITIQPLDNTDNIEVLDIDEISLKVKVSLP